VTYAAAKVHLHGPAVEATACGVASALVVSEGGLVVSSVWFLAQRRDRRCGACQRALEDQRLARVR